MARPTPTATTNDQPAPQSTSTVDSSVARVPAPPKTRRRPLLIVLAVVLIALGSLLAAFLVTLNQRTVSVVAVRENIIRGDVISANVLQTVEVPPNSGLQTIPASDIQHLVGKRAALDIHAGGLVSPGSVAEAPFPGAGRSVVGMSLKAGQLPTVRSLKAGDKVMVVYTPRAQDELGESTTGRQIQSEVVGIREVPDTSEVVLDVTVASNQAAQLADIVATQRVAVILQGA